MIRQSLTLITQQLETYLDERDSTGTLPHVVLGNVGLITALGGNQQFMNDKIIVSLVNSMEEASMRNNSPIRKSVPIAEVELPPVFLNLYFLFTANFPYDGTDVSVGISQYNRAMDRLSHIVEFFQGNKQFTIQNTPDATLLTEPLAQDLCINMELVSLTFEQINYLWGSLGGKQMPFVLYKAHLVPVKRVLVTGRGGLVQEIQSESLHLKPSQS